jgi:tetratricopeptide (TPR) repeat protein
MNRKERRAARKTAGPAPSPMAQVLATAFRAHQAGHCDEAERLYRDVLAVEPRNAAALHLLGALAQQGGRSAEAISLLGQAAAIEPANPDHHYNLGCVLQAAHRFQEAATHFERTLTLNPAHREALFELGNCHAGLRQWEEAASAFQRALAKKPNDAATINNLALVKREQGALDDAVALWRRAVAAAPDFHLAHMNLGAGLRAQGALDEAEASFVRALELRPEAGDVLYNLAAVRVERGRPQDALQDILRGLEKTPTTKLRTLFLICVEALPQIPVDERLRKAVAQALRERWGRNEPLALVAATMLRHHPVMAAAIDKVNKQWPRPIDVTELLPPGGLAVLAQDELLLAALESAPVVDFDLERVLTALGLALRANARPDDGDGRQRLALALSRQDALNGEIWLRTDGDAPKPAADAATEAADTGFARAPEPLTIEDYLRQTVPQAAFAPLDRAAPLDILVLDCGRGQRALEAAARHTANVRALDGDAEALAFAQAQACRHGLAVAFGPGDAASVAGQSFDVIDAGGAPRSAEDLAALAALLRPRGLVRIEIDNACMREAVAAAQDFVRSGNYQPDIEGVRSVRQNLMRLPDDHPARRLAQRVEFYMAEGCRALLFRERQDALTAATLTQALQGAGLVAVGGINDGAPDRPTTLAFWAQKP